MKLSYDIALAMLQYQCCPQYLTSSLEKVALEHCKDFLHV